MNKSHLRESGSCKVSLPSEINIATDGSHHSLNHSSAYLGTNGNWGVTAARFKRDPCSPSCALATELRAVWYALEKVAPETPLTIMTDSESTRVQIEKWQSGRLTMPSWYNMRERSSSAGQLVQPTLVSLRDKVVKEAPSIKIRHVKGHNGDLLNEAADALAGIGLNYLRSRYNKAEASRRCGSLALSFLVSYAQEVK